MTLSAIVMTAIFFLFSAFFSGVETGAYMLNRIRLKQRERERSVSALVLSKVLENTHLFIFTVLIGNNIVVFLLSRQITGFYLDSGLETSRLLLGLIPWNAEMAATLTLMFPLFLFAEIGPKNLFRKKADVLMYRFSSLMQLLIWILYPFTWPLKQLFRLLTHGLEDPGRELHRLSPNALKEYFSVSEKEGAISSDQNRMVGNVISMHSKPLRTLMTPLKKMPVLPDTASVADFKRLAARRKTTDVLLMHKHTVIGEVSMYSIICQKLGNDELLKPYARVLLLIKERQSLKSAFYHLRHNPRRRAIVVDAWNHPVGFIRLEDIACYIAAL